MVGRIDGNLKPNAKKILSFLPIGLNGQAHLQNHPVAFPQEIRSAPRKPVPTDLSSQDQRQKSASRKRKYNGGFSAAILKLSISGYAIKRAFRA